MDAPHIGWADVRRYRIGVQLLFSRAPVTGPLPLPDHHPTDCAREQERLGVHLPTQKSLDKTNNDIVFGKNSQNEKGSQRCINNRPKSVPHGSDPVSRRVVLALADDIC